MTNLTIRKSKMYQNLILTCNSEKVYRVYLDGQEKINNMDYDKVSDYFEQLERDIYFA